MSTRSRYKRTASEMTDVGPLVIDESVKRSRLEMMLQQQPPRHNEHQQSFPPCRPVALHYSSAIHKPEPGLSWELCGGGGGSSSSNNSCPSVLASVAEPCSHTTIPTASFGTVPAHQSILPDLKQELTVSLPVTSHDTCSLGSISSGSSNWSTDATCPPNPLSQQQQDQSFDDSGCWMNPGTSADDSAYCDYNTPSSSIVEWKNGSNTKTPTDSYELLNTPPPLPAPPVPIGNDNPSVISSSSLFEEDIFGAPPYQADELLNQVVQPIDDATCSPPTFDSTYADLNDAESLAPLPHRPIGPVLSSLVCAFDYVVKRPEHGPLFRLQRPGNPTPIFVHSGRGVILPSFSLTLPRVTSYIH